MKKIILISILLILLALIFTWPLVLNLNTLILNKQDGLLITWILNWNISHPFDYNTNIFYPFKNTLAFSEVMFPLAFLTAIPVKIFQEPLLAYNLSFLLALVLTPLSMYLLLKNVLIALIFTYSPIFLGYTAHLQLLNFWPVILAIYFLINKKFWLFAIFVPIAATTSVLFTYFLLLVTITQSILTKNLKSILYFGVGGVLFLPFLLPYFSVSREFHYVRPLTDAIHNSLYIPILFFILLVPLIFAKPRLFPVIAISSFILALGPALHLVKDTVHIGPIPAIPLPYTIFYYLLPGFSGLRTPSRWIILAFFALCVFFSIKIKRPLFYVFILLIFIVTRTPFKYQEVPKLREFPPEQVWLKNNFAGAPTIQFPIYGWWNEPGVTEETLRMYYSTIHWHPMYNGYSGFSPKDWEEKVIWLQKEFPSPQAVEYLKGLKIKLILVPKNWEVPSAKKIVEFPDIMIYEIL